MPIPPFVMARKKIVNPITSNVSTSVTTSALVTPISSDFVFTISLNPDQLQTFDKILEIALAGNPDSNVKILAQQMKAKLK